MTITLILLTIGGVAIGRGLVRILRGPGWRRSAVLEIVAGVGLLLTALAGLADPGTSVARILGLASTTVLVTAVLLIARADARHPARNPDQPR